VGGYWSGIAAILCINLIFAYAVFLPVATGQLNLGGAGFQALGAYTAAYLSAAQGVPIWLTLPAAALVGGLIGFLIAFPVLRTRGVYMVLATFAFGEVVGGLIINSEALGGAMGLSVPDYLDLGVIAPITLAAVLFVFYLMSTRLGLAMRAIHDDETVSDLMGVGVRGVQVTAFALGGMLAGLSGALYAHHFSYVEIQNFNALVSIYVLLYVLLGGTQTVWGPLVGATFFTLLPELLRGALPRLSAALEGLVGGPGAAGGGLDDSWRFVLLGVATIAMMALRPEGLVTRTLVERLTPGGRAAKGAA